MILKLLVKTGLAGGAVYYSISTGVWGTGKQSEILYKECSNAMQPLCKEVSGKLPFEVPPLPKSGEVRFLAKHYYNEGVKSTIHFIYMLPCYSGQLVKKGYDAINQAIEAPAKNPK